MYRILAVTAVIIMTSLLQANADSPVVVKAEAVSAGKGVYSFSVTVQHQDTGWKHYANKWDVVTMDGRLLGTRELLHPHVNEQPFTRSLRSVKIPDDIKKVKIRVHDSVHGYGKTEYEIDLRK